MSERRYRLAGEIFGAMLEGANGATRVVRIANGSGRRRVRVEIEQSAVVLDGVRRRLCVARTGNVMHISVDGEVFEVEALSDLAEAVGDARGEEEIYAPMPGQIVAVHVRAGEQVAAGDTLVILESMKLHSNLTAPSAGVVSDLAAEAGASVDKGDILLRIISPGNVDHAQD